MNPLLKKVELSLAPLFKNMPAIPKNGKEGLVKSWPIIALVFGVLQLIAAYGLWRIGHRTNEFVDYVNQLAPNYGLSTVNHLGFTYWLGLLVLVADGAILLLAYSGLKARHKSGWDLLFLGALVNLAYGLVMVFDDNYGGFGRLVSSLIGSFIGLYLLFQVRDAYDLHKATAHTTHPTKRHVRR